MVQGCSVQRQLFFPLGRIIVVVHKAATAVPKSVEEVLGLKLAEVTTEEETRIWNELILREHPLRECRLVGRQLRVNMKLKRLTGERPSTVLAWHRVAEGNCVAVRRGGEQPEANLSSQSSQIRRLNPIRPFGMASLRRKGEALALSLPEAITKHDHTIAKDSDGVWDEKAGKAEQLSVEILLGATESGEEVRALIVALKRVTTVEPRGVGR